MWKIYNSTVEAACDLADFILYYIIALPISFVVIIVLDITETVWFAITKEKW